MTFADEVIEELILSKELYYQDIECHKLSVESIFSQAIRLHCYAKGLEYALQEKHEQVSQIPIG